MPTVSSSPPSASTSSNYSFGPNTLTVHLGGLPGNIGPAGIGEGFVLNPKISNMIVQLWEDPIMALDGWNPQLTGCAASS